MRKAETEAESVYVTLQRMEKDGVQVKGDTRDRTSLSAKKMHCMVGNSWIKITTSTTTTTTNN